MPRPSPLGLWENAPSSEPVKFRGTDQILLGNPAAGVRPVAHLHCVIPHMHLGVMVLPMRHPRHRIDECDGFVMVRERPLANDFVPLQLPLRQRYQFQC